MFEKVLNLPHDKKMAWVKKKFIDVYEDPCVKKLNTSSNELYYYLQNVVMLIENDPSIIDDIAKWDDDNLILQSVKSAIQTHYVDDFVVGKDGFMLLDRVGSFVITIAMFSYH